MKLRGMAVCPYPYAVVPGLSFGVQGLDPQPVTHRPTAQTVAALHLVGYDPHLGRRTHTTAELNHNIFSHNTQSYTQPQRRHNTPRNTEAHLFEKGRLYTISTNTDLI